MAKAFQAPHGSGFQSRIGSKFQAWGAPRVDMRVAYATRNDSGDDLFVRSQDLGPIWSRDTGTASRVVFAGGGALAACVGNTIHYFDRSGNELWSVSTDASSNIAADNDGSVYAVYRPDPVGDHIDIRKFNAQGGVEWTVTRDGPRSGLPAVEADGNLLVGLSGTPHSGIIRVSPPDGDVLMSISFHEEGLNTNVAAVAPSEQGGFFTSQLQESDADDNGDQLKKFSNSGVLQWKISLAARWPDQLVTDWNGGVYSVTLTSGFNTIHRIDGSGSIIWTRSDRDYLHLGGIGSDTARHLYVGFANVEGDRVVGKFGPNQGDLIAAAPAPTDGGSLNDIATTHSVALRG